MVDKQKEKHRKLIIVGSLLVQFALGGVYAWSVFTPELINIGWTKFQTQAVFSAASMSIALSMLFSGFLLKKLGPQKLVLLGGVLLSSAYLLAGLLAKGDFHLTIMTIGVMGGSGIGLAYMVPLVVSMSWFPYNKGLITGIVVAGFGLSVMGWVKLAGSWGGLLHSYGLYKTFIIYGFSIFTLVLCGSFFLNFPHDYKAGILNDSSEFSRLKMLKNGKFYLIFLSYIACAAAGLMAIGLMKIYPMEVLISKGYEKQSASLICGTAMAVFFSLANGVGRISWGALSDKIGRKCALFLLALLQGCWLIIFPTFAQNSLSLYVGASLIGFNFGGNFSLFPAITADIFGSKSLGNNYPIVNLAFGIGGLLGPTLGGFLGDRGQFPLSFFIAGVLCVCASILIFFLKTDKDDAAGI